MLELLFLLFYFSFGRIGEQPLTVLQATTIFAVMCALIFPAIHVGRIWVIYWVFPIPNQMVMWPNFNSPYFGTCLRYRPILQFRYSFGM